MYISLKQGWVSLSDICSKYNKDKANMNRLLDKLSDTDKEKIGQTWVVRESEIVKFIKDADFEIDTYTIINNIVDDFTTELSKKLNSGNVRPKFIILNKFDGDYVLNTFLDWACKCEISFPQDLFKYLRTEEYELYTKSNLVIKIWDKCLQREKSIKKIKES